MLDTASTGSIDALVQDVQRQGLSLSALVNNAAVQTPGWSQQEFDDGIACNFAGPLLLAERLLPCIHDGARQQQCCSCCWCAELNHSAAGRWHCRECLVRPGAAERSEQGLPAAGPLLIELGRLLSTLLTLTQCRWRLPGAGRISTPSSLTPQISGRAASGVPPTR